MALIRLQRDRTEVRSGPEARRHHSQGAETHRPSLSLRRGGLKVMLQGGYSYKYSEPGL